MYELGNVFGYVLFATVIGTLLNHVIKALNKRLHPYLKPASFEKKLFSVLMKLFVANHRFWGMASILLLLIHFLLQFLNIGLNPTGLIAGSLLILQAVLGRIGYQKKLPRKGLWFHSHRILAVFILCAALFHFFAPYSLNNYFFTTVSSTTLPLPSSADASSSKLSTNETNSSENSSTKMSTELSNLESVNYTLEELSTFDGKNGNPAYVAYEGVIYDVSNVAAWSGGTHNGQLAGTDITDAISKSPHKTSVLEDLPVVGNLIN